MSGVTNNPDGKNQHKDCPSKGDLKSAELLRKYHDDGKTNRNVVSDLLRRDHGISMSSATVARRWKDMGLAGSTATTRDMAPEVRRQHVADACAKDPAGRQGPGSIRENIRLDSTVHLTVKCVREEMRVLNPGGFAARDPNSKKIHRTNLVSKGPHAEWSADGHDKLKEAGYAIWGVRDKWSRKWIGLWVVPCNRTLEVIGYCYLAAILNEGGRPEQSTTDCGSETTLMYGLAMALAEYSRQAAPADEAGNGGGDGDAEANDEGPVHQFLKSIRNITIERGWVSVKYNVIDNLRIWWDSGKHLVNRQNPHQNDLANWLWSRFIQASLDQFCIKMNSHAPRRIVDQLLPSAVSPNDAIEHYHEYNGEWSLQPIDLNVVRRLQEAIGGEQLIQFNTPEYRHIAQGVFDSLNIGTVTGINIWVVYQEMLPRMLGLVEYV